MLTAHTKQNDKFQSTERKRYNIASEIDEKTAVIHQASPSIKSVSARRISVKSEKKNQQQNGICSHYIMIIFLALLCTLCDSYDLFPTFSLLLLRSTLRFCFFKRITYNSCFLFPRIEHWSKFSDGGQYFCRCASCRPAPNAFNWKRNPSGHFCFHSSRLPSLWYIPIIMMQNAKQKMNEILHWKFCSFYLDADGGRLEWKEKYGRKGKENRNNAMPLQRVCAVQCALNWQASPFNKCYPQWINSPKMQELKRKTSVSLFVSSLRPPHRMQIKSVIK